MKQEQSEFGSGIVVCLAKFSEHLWNDREPSLDGELSDGSRSMRGSKFYDSDEHLYSREVEIWANGASDHFYDLDRRAPKALRELASLTLEMGHGFTGKVWTPDDMKRVRELWKESCLAIDRRMLHVKADWGEW